jgi:hypothetical protein
MSEIGGITELQLLEGEVKLLKKKLDVAKGADRTSMGCSRIVSSMQGSQTKDGFVVTEGSAPNIFHTAAGTAGETGCCIIS